MIGCHWRLSARRGALIVIMLLASVGAQGSDLPRLFLADRLREQGERSLAVEEYRYLADTGALGALPSLGIGATYLDWGRDDAAIEAFQKALVLEPSSFTAWSGIGIARLNQKKCSEALTAWERAVELRPWLAAPRYHLGVALLCSGEFAKATTTFDELLEYGITDDLVRDVHFRLGQLALLECAEEAEKHLEAAVLIKGELPEAELTLAALKEVATAGQARRWAFLGHSQLRISEWALADALLQSALEHPPYPAEVPAYLAYAWWRQGREDEALATLVAAPESPLSRYFLALMHRERGDLPEAVLNLRRAVELDPSSPELSIELARTCVMVADYVCAERALHETVRTAPDDPIARVFLASYYLEHAFGLPQAMSSARQAVELAPDSAAAQYVLGWAYLQSGELAQAESALRLAIKLDPGHLAARYRLAETLRQAGRNRSAESELRRAIDLDPSDLSRRAEGGQIERLSSP